MTFDHGVIKCNACKLQTEQFQPLLFDQIIPDHTTSYQIIPEPRAALLRELFLEDT